MPRTLIAVAQDGVKLTFVNGAALEDPAGVFSASRTGSTICATRCAHRA